MERRYKIEISNKSFYREFELPTGTEEVRLGTGVDCELRLHKQFFFESIALTFSRVDSGWAVRCADNLYFTVGDVRKLLTINLSHGTSISIKYRNSDTEAFSLQFWIDFESEKPKYERAVNLRGVNYLRIGASSQANLLISGPYVEGDDIEVLRQNASLILTVRSSRYGVYHNGNRTASRQVTIQNSDFFSISDFFFYYKNDILWTQIRPDMRFNGLSYQDLPSPGAYPRFDRNTRLKTVVNEDAIEILDPPANPQKPKNNLLMRLLPSLGMILAAGVMAFFGGMMIIMSVISGAMAIFTSIMSIREGNKDYEEAVAKRNQQYSLYIENKQKEIEQCRQNEWNELERIYVSPMVLRQRFDSFSPDLFDRRPEDTDFLCVRLGSGEVRSHRQVNYKKQERLESDDLQMIPEKISQDYKMVHNAPVVCDLKNLNALGIVGAAHSRFEFLKNMVFDLAGRQHFSDLKMVFIAEKEHAEEILWLRFLPYVLDEEKGIRNIVCDDESKNMVFESLYKEFTQREQSKTRSTNIVLFFYDEYGFANHPLSRFLDHAREIGVTFIFFGSDFAHIPQGCDSIVSILDAQNAVLVPAQNQEESSPFIYTAVSSARMSRMVQELAPVYTEEISLEGTLTRNISLFELLNIFGVDDLALKERWARSQVQKSMAAPIGVSKTGVIYLDLHDKAHGPHGLVAGTTGSGKSEILQTYILSMATLFHPYEVGFVIIDFKGGGMVNQFRNLPHLLGAITNIDGKEIDRSLKSIKAELEKRQRLFAEADVNHIDRYIGKYKNGEARAPLPHLIIIVDEFAELKAEQPEFMKELISAARIGRSLGVHLILATQKPSGQVNEQIWSNSRFKLCLKVQSQEDSNEVLKSPLAAEIKEPGRAYLQVGNNEIFELFQSAYSGASEKIDDSKVKEFSIYSLTDSGKRVPVYIQKKQKAGEESSTQLDAIVRYISSYCETEHILKLPDICLPSLSEHIAFPDREQLGEATSNIIADIGIYDDPDNQYQGQYTIDLTNQNVMIIGSAQSGKTNILQNIIRSISTKYTPKEVSIYIIDFASMVLKTYEKLNHVGGVVTPSEDEKLKNLMKLLKTKIETRKEKLLSVGVSSFAAYKEAGQEDLPQIVLLIDNLTALKELYFQDDDELLNLCREGLSVGISIVIANAQTAGIGYKYLSNFSCRIAMFCNDSGEYSALFDHCRERLEDIHGRCIIEIDKVHLDCQAYLAFEGEKEIHRVNAIKEYIANTNAKNAKMFANIIPVIPDTLTLDYVSNTYSPYMQGKYSIAIGLDYDSVSPCIFDLSSLGVLAISGREGSGRSNIIKYITCLLETMHPGTSEVYIVDGIGRKLSGLKEKANVVSYDVLPDRGVELIKAIEKELQKRYTALAEGDEVVLENSTLLLLVLNSADAVEAITNDSAALTAYKNITGKYRNMNVCILLGSFENVNIPYSAPEIIKKARDTKHFLFFDDLSNMKIIDMPLSVMRRYKKPIETGDCYYIKDNECVKLKTAIVSKREVD